MWKTKAIALDASGYEIHSVECEDARPFHATMRAQTMLSSEMLDAAEQSGDDWKLEAIESIVIRAEWQETVEATAVDE